MWLFLALMIVLLCLCAYIGAIPKAKLRKYTQIEIGMSEDEMLSIMGKGYNRSLLKNNRKKYEWRVAAVNSKYARTGVMKVDIYVKDGIVEEVRPFNV